MRHPGRRRARQAIQSARRAIIRVAARWQKTGLDTSPLIEVLLSIETALKELDATDKPTRRPRRTTPTRASP